ncbi:hypothetical protein [Methylobacterium sp. JK268]
MCRLLTALAVVGLLTGALAAPSRALASASMASQAATAQPAADMEDMPCCDPVRGAPDHRDMADCPFLALCVAKVLAGPAFGAVGGTRAATAAAQPLRDDLRRDGLSTAPRGHPPKPLS